MRTNFRNTEDMVETFEIDETGDYLIHNTETEEWYYWLESTSPLENIGPYESAEEAKNAYYS